MERRGTARSPRKTGPCALWYKNERGQIVFEVMDDELSALRRAHELGVEPEGFGGSRPSPVLGIQHSDGTSVDLESWDTEYEEPPPKERGGEVREPTPKMKEVTDPFTGEKIKVWTAPEWLGGEDEATA